VDSEKAGAEVGAAKVTGDEIETDEQSV